MKIVVVGLAGTNKHETGELLSDRLGYKFWSAGHEIHKVEDPGEEEKDIHKVKAGLTHIIEETSKLHKTIDDQTQQFCEGNEDCVCVGKAAAQHVPSAFKILLYAEMHERILRRVVAKKLHEDEVRRRILGRDFADRTKYGIYFDCPYEFDLAINVSQFTAEEVVELILGFLCNR